MGLGENRDREAENSFLSDFFFLLLLCLTLRYQSS